MNFESEKQMSVFMQNFLSENFLNENINYYREFKGVFGIPDYLIIQKRPESLEYIISLELKLKNWKQALKQAFRYKNYSNESFVVMDEVYVDNALKEKDLFCHYNIGLASINKEKQFKIHFYPEPSSPFSKHYIKKMIKKLLTKHNLELNYEETNSPLLHKFLKKYNTYDYDRHVHVR